MDAQTTKQPTSQYRGVSKHRNSWRAGIKAFGITTMLGSFKTEEAAARAYDDAAKEYHGDKAKLNFPDVR